MSIYDTREGVRLLMNQQHQGHWNRWGPYLSERAWGTVREDYSAGGAAWNYFPPTLSNLGNIDRRQQSSFDSGVIRSDGKTQESLIHSRNTKSWFSRRASSN